MSFRNIENLVIGSTNSVFGSDVVYDPVTGSNVSLKGVFDVLWVETEGVTSLKPTLRIRLSDLPQKPRKGDSVTVNSSSYRVLESREDSYGGSTLILQKV